MSSSRSTVFVLILIGVVSALAGVFGNVAASALPEGWQPYLWLAWPLFILFTAAGIGLAVWHARRDPPAPLQPAANPSPPPATQSLNHPVTQSTNLPISQSTSDHSYPYDVFISYSSADKEWVRGELLQALEEAGLRVCIDFRDFQPGAPSVTEMERAVLTSQRTLLVLTPAYLRSAWTEFEALMLQTLDAANRERRLIPLLRERCELPLRIGYLTYVNFVDPGDPAWAWTQLLTALGAPPAAEAEQPATPAAWFLAHPYAMPPNFTGRQAERALLTDWLVNDGEHPLLVISALGGFGKSALAWHWLLHDVDASRWPRVVWWSFYEPQASFESFLAETLAYLGVDPRRYPGPRQQADALLALLRQPGTLLILDGFERAMRAYSSLMAAYQGDEVAGEQVAGDKLQVADGQPVGADGPPPLTINRSLLPINHSDLDCVSPVAEHFLRSLATLPGLRGKLLMTTRLLPRVLQGHGGDLLLGCRLMELTQMQPADAVAFFRSQGIRGGRAEIEAACAHYGYHPLSLRLLAGLVKTDLRQPGDIAAAKRLDVSGSLVQRQHHVLEAAYGSLAPARQQLLSRIACFRGPVGYEALAAVAALQKPGFSSAKPGSPGELFEDDEPLREEKKPGFAVAHQKPGFSPAKPGSPGELFEGDEPLREEKKPGFSEGALDAALHDLVDRGLLHRDLKTNRFDLHPIVRRYAYDRLAGDARSATHASLRDYFSAVLPPDKAQTLDDLAPVIELYHHTVAAGQYDEARTLFRDRIDTPTYYQFGAYQLQIELLRGLFPDGEEKPPRLKEERAQASTLNDLALVYSLSGQPRRAVPLFERQIAIREKQGDKMNLAIGLGNLADDQAKIGTLRAAEANLRRRIELCREIGDEFNEAVGHQYLGWLLAYRGAWEEAEGELLDAQKVFDEMGPGETNYGSVNRAYSALRALLLMRAASPGADLPTAALHAAQRALELAEGGDPSIGGAILPRDMVRAHWLLGAAHRANGDPDAADRHFLEALTRCRGINMVDHEADILLDLARLRRDQSQISEVSETSEILRADALRLAEEALLITERSGYVLQGADVRLFLAQLSLDAGDRAAALEHARQACQLATCDGPPDYTYKVAYDEAGALVARLEATSNSVDLTN